MQNHSKFNFSRKLMVELIGTALLVAAIVGSGIMGEKLSGGNDALALLTNTLATGAALVVLILIFSPISGAHFNPVVSLSFSLQGKLPWSELIPYFVVQIVGAICGTIIAHLMFDLPLVTLSTHERTGLGIWTGEFIATFGLLISILGCARSRPEAIPYAVGLFITSAYWFTSSTSFANLAVTIARALTDTFSGISPQNVLSFIGLQIVGSLAATGFFAWLYSEKNPL